MNLFFGRGRKRYRRGIARIPVHGEIVPLRRGPVRNGVTSNEVAELLEEAEEDRYVKAAILDINSPGGALVASREMGRAVRSFSKPVVAWIRDVGASGAYEVAIAADRIVADAFSIVGSVGVIAPLFEVTALLEKIGVKPQLMKAGKYKDLGVPTREMTEEERTILQDRLDRAHEGFLQDVSKARELKPEALEDIRTGLTFFGTQAKELGLVDDLGGLERAIRACEELGRFTHDEVVLFEPEKPSTLLSYLFGNHHLPTPANLLANLWQTVLPR